MMDWLLAPGGLLMMIIGFIGLFRADLLWRMYSLEPRWRKENPEKPEDWHNIAQRQGYVFLAVGVIFILLSVVLAV